MGSFQDIHSTYHQLWAQPAGEDYADLFGGHPFSYSCQEGVGHVSSTRAIKESELQQGAGSQSVMNIVFCPGQDTGSVLRRPALHHGVQALGSQRQRDPGNPGAEAPACGGGPHGGGAFRVSAAVQPGERHREPEPRSSQLCSWALRAAAPGPRFQLQSSLQSLPPRQWPPPAPRSL